MDGFSWQVIGYLLPEIILALAGCALLLFGAYWKNNCLLFGTTLVSLSLALASTLSLFGTEAKILYGTMDIDTFSLLLKATFIVLSMLTVWGSQAFTADLIYRGEYYALLVLATLGLSIVSSAADIITLFVAFELTSIATYALPLIDLKNPQGKEAAIKYFITGAFSSGLILFGLSWIYGLSGSVYLDSMVGTLAQHGGSPLLVVALILMIAGFGYKMTIAPFHLWAPDAYQGAPTPVTAFLAGSTKKGAFVVALKLFLVALVAIKLQTNTLLGVLAVVTMTVGNAVALMQEDTKRMLAYSSVAHAGNILVGLAIFTQLAVAGAILHIIAHGIMTIGIFFGLLLVAGQRGGYELPNLAGLRKAAPWTAFALFLILLSLAGVPPFLGFWSKMVIVISAFELGGWFAALALALVLNSALSLVYYARVIKVMYMEPETEPVKLKECSSYLTVLYACVLLLTIVGFFPEQLVAISTEAARFIIP